MSLSRFQVTKLSHPSLPFLLGQCILTGLLWGLRSALKLDADFDSVLLIGVLLATGIPHGANDLSLLRQRFPTWSWTGAFVRYLALVVVAIGLMACFPGLGLVLFLGLSAYHFGQGDLQRYIPFPRSRTAGWLYLSWGALLLTALLGLHTSALAQYLPPTKGTADLIRQLARLPHSPWAYLTLAAGLLALTVGGGYLRISNGLWRLMMTGLLFMLFAQTSLLFSFSVYFGIWHSAEAIELFSQRLYVNPTTARVRQFYVQALPLTGLAGGLLAGLAYWGGHVSASYPVLFWLLTFLFGLTLPHVLVSEPVYRHVAP